MKRVKIIILSSILLVLCAPDIHAQILKGFGKKLEKKIENRIDRKADRHVDKALDKADNASDKSINDALKPSKKNVDNIKKEEKSILDKQAVKSSVEYQKLNLTSVTARPDQLMTLSDGDCNQFLWFSKGAMLEYENRDAVDKLESRTQIEIKDVKQEKGKMIAEVDAKVEVDGEEQRISMNYICEGDKLYMDFSGMFKSILADNPDLKQYLDASQNTGQKGSFDMDNGFATFPKELYPGLELEDVSFSFSTAVAGIATISISVELIDRVVVAREEITTDAGTFDCMKIRSVSFSTFDMMGKKRNMPPHVEYLWIAPKIGMVKQEIHSQGDKGSYSMELTKYKI